MADGEVKAQDLAQETAGTLSGNEQFVMFDSTAGKRADIDDVATYVAGDKTTLKTTNKTSPVAAINENFDAIADVKEDLQENVTNIQHFIYPFITNEYEQGYINRTTGADDTSGANDYYVRSVGLQYNKYQTKIYVDTDYAIYIYYYKGDGTYINSTDPISGAEATIQANSYVRFSLRYNPARILSASDVYILQHKFLKQFDFVEANDLQSVSKTISKIDITDPNWTADGNYITNGFLPLDISQDYFLYVPKGLSVLVLLKSDGASTGDIGWFTESHILSFSGIPFDIFTKFALKALIYNGYDTSADNAYPKLLKVGENKNVKTITFDMTKNGYVSTETGAITTTTDEYWGISDYIVIPHNTKTILTNVRYRSSVPFGYAIYDQNKNFVRGGQSNRIPVKNTDRYIVVCDAYSIPNHPSTHDKRTVCFVGNDSVFSNKIIAFSGDSVTYGYNDALNGMQLDNTWVNQVANNLGVKQVYNYGVSSASLMRDEDTPVAIIDAYEDYENSIDIIGFMIGINDAYRDYPFGTVNDTTENTFLGCMNALCVGIVNKWKPSDGKSVFIMLYPQADQTLIDRPDVQYKGLTGWDAWNEAVKDVAGKYAIPVCDLYHNLGITPHLDTNNVYWGGTPTRHSAHPTQIGANVIAKYVSNWIGRTFRIN